jgi:hypothetical protein
VAETIKIPKPTAEQELALSRAGVSNHRLVWDRNNRKWTIKTLDKVASADITYDDWRGGTKSYEPTTGNISMPSDIADKVKATTDPLFNIVEKYGLKVVTDPATGRTELQGFEIDPKTGKRTTTAVPFFLYLDSKNQIQISTDYDSVKSKAIADLKSTGKLDSLFQDLYNKKKISKETFNSRNIAASDFNSALLDSISQYSRNVIANRELGTTEAPDFLGFVQGTISGGGGTPNLPTREFQDISKAELNNFIDQIYLETIGRKPSEEQRAAKLKELNKIVKKGILSTRKVVGGEVQYRTTGGFDEKEQALKLQSKLKEENPLEYERRQAFGFMDELNRIMSGGM